MEKIESFDFVLQYLKEMEVVCTSANRQLTYYHQNRDGMISVNTPNAHYLIDFDAFRQLFAKEVFYLYTRIEDGIDTEKDDAYYTWKNKNAN